MPGSDCSDGLYDLSNVYYQLVFLARFDIFFRMMFCAEGFLDYIIPLSLTTNVIRLHSGGGGIRTLGRLLTSPAYKAGAINLSATPEKKPDELLLRNGMRFTNNSQRKCIMSSGV